MLRRLKNIEPYRAVLAAPLLLVLHLAEEAPGFVDWFNTLVADGITQAFFYTVNAFGLLITIAVVAFAASAKTDGGIVPALVWLSFVMPINGLFHLTATVVHGMYSPGVVTAVVLFCPYYAWFVWLVVKRTKLNRAGIAVAILAGATPLAIHGYLIIFEGSRLF